MQRPRFAALAAAVLLSLASVAVALADGGKGVAVQPLTPTPGDVITVKGDSLGPNSIVEVRIVGLGVDLDLGEAQADAAGDVTARFTLPATLTPGTYQLRAAGGESAATQITVLGGGAADPNAMQPAPEIRSRPLSEAIPLIALFGALAGVGVYFARFTRRGHSATRP